MEIQHEQDGFNRTLTYFYNPDKEEHNEHFVYFYTNPNSLRHPNNSKGEIGIICKYDNETVYIGRESKEQYLKLCEIINEINNNEVN